MVTHPHLSEREIQRATLRALAAFGFQAFHVPNEVRLPGDRMARLKQAARRKADGVRAGVPDLVIIHRDGRVGFVEVKEEFETQLDPDQVWWRDELLRRRMPWALVNTPTGIDAVLCDWGWM